MNNKKKQVFDDLKANVPAWGTMCQMLAIGRKKFNNTSDPRTGVEILRDELDQVYALYEKQWGGEAAENSFLSLLMLRYVVSHLNDCVWAFNYDYNRVLLPSYKLNINPRFHNTIDAFNDKFTELNEAK